MLMTESSSGRTRNRPCECPQHDCVWKHQLQAGRILALQASTRSQHIASLSLRVFLAIKGLPGPALSSLRRLGTTRFNCRCPAAAYWLVSSDESNPLHFNQAVLGLACNSLKAHHLNIGIIRLPARLPLLSCHHSLAHTGNGIQTDTQIRPTKRKRKQKSVLRTSLTHTRRSLTQKSAECMIRCAVLQQLAFLTSGHFNRCRVY